MKMNFGLIFYIAAGLLVFSSNATAQRIPGVPGVDYPEYHSLPKTSFKCSEQKYIPGFYADLETDCQVFHFCYKHRSESFLCPTGTTFNQAILACDSWYNSNCSLASLFYVVNAGPGMVDAGKNLPMLLKLRDRAQNSASVQPTISAPEEIPFEQKDEEIQSAEGQDTDRGSTKIESSVDYLQNQSEVVDDEKSEAADVQHLDVERVAAEEVSTESIRNKTIPQDFPDNVGGFDQPKEEKKENLVYDTISQEDFIEKFHPDAEWNDETERLSDQFRNFYDYNRQMMDSAEYQHFQDGDEHFESSEESDPQNLPDNLKDDRSEEKMDEFSKRLLRASHIPRRRKQTYVVLDTPELGRPVYEPPSESLESMDSPFTESISMDTLVELNTELPDEYSFVKDEENYEYGGVNTREMQNVADSGEEISFFDPRLRPELDGLQTEAYEQDRYDVGLQDENEQYEIGQGTPEYLQSADEDLSQYDPDSFSDLAASDSAENGASDSVDDIFVYDDSVDSRETELDPRSAQDSGFVVIPDETDFSTSDPTADFSEDLEGGSENYSENYVVSEDPNEVDGNVYVYDDSAENQQVYGYEQDIEEQQYYDPQTQGSYESYGTSEDMAQSDYRFRSMPEGVDYSQLQGLDYNFNQYGTYKPGSYYQYDEYGRLVGPKFRNPEMHPMPEEARFPNPDTPGQVYSEPDDIYQHGVFGDSYAYNTQPDEQAGFANQYSYNPQLGFFQSPDGRFYTSEGEEIPQSMIPDDVDPADFVPLSEYEGEPDSSFELNYAQQDDAEGFEALEESDSSDLAPPTDESAESQEENLDVAESGLVEDLGHDGKDTFFIIDEDVADDNAEESEFTESDSEQSEEVIDDLASKDNASEPVQPGNNTESGVETSRTTEEGKDKPFPHQAKDKTGRTSESTWAEQPFDMGAMDLPPASAQQLLNTFDAANFPNVQDFVAPTETQFLNNMAFQNPMDFGPYGFGPNMGQQLGMLDSSNVAPFSTGEVQEKPVNSDKSRLSKLSSFQERVRSMKRGKFGMFKKYINSMKKD